MSRHLKRKSRSHRVFTLVSETEALSTLPCSITGCERVGTRLVGSLREKHDLKDDMSGRICEGHYRKDLRKFKNAESKRENGIEEEEKESDSSHDEDLEIEKNFKSFCEYVLKSETTV